MSSNEKLHLKMVPCFTQSLHSEKTVDLLPGAQRECSFFSFYVP